MFSSSCRAISLHMQLLFVVQVYYPIFMKNLTRKSPNVIFLLGKVWSYKSISFMDQWLTILLTKNYSLFFVISSQEFYLDLWFIWKLSSLFFNQKMVADFLVKEMAFRFLFYYSFSSTSLNKVLLISIFIIWLKRVFFSVFYSYRTEKQVKVDDFQYHITVKLVTYI